MAALTLRIPPLEARREVSETALTLRIPPLEARREVETVTTTPVAYDPPMAALTLRIPPREARREIEGPEKPLVLRLPAPSQAQFRPQPQSSAGSTSKTQDVESSSGKLCYKCNKPLPNVKWPWKRCLECRLSAERLAQESTAAHATGRKVRKPRVKCTICTGLTTTPPFCQPCRKLGITGPLSDTKRARTQSSTASTSTSQIDRPPKRHKPNNVERTRPRPTPITPIIAEYGKSHSQIFDTLVPLQYSTSNGSSQNSNAANFVSPDWPLDRIIDKLATAKHFNDRGEYIFPQFLPPESLARVQNENAQIPQPLSTPTSTHSNSSSTSSFPPQVCRTPSCGQPLDSKDTKRKLCKQCVAQIMGDAKLYDRSNEVKPTPSSLAMALVFPDTTKVKTKTAKSTSATPTPTTTTTTSATVGQSKTMAAAVEIKDDLERQSVPTTVVDLASTTTTTTTIAPGTTVPTTTISPIFASPSRHDATSAPASTPAITTIDPSMLMLQPPTLPTQGLFPTSIPFPTPPPSSRRASPESEEGVDEVRAGGDDTEDESGVDEGEGEGEGEGVPGWDSELTELTESEGDGDEVESEVDVPLKDATTSQTTTATASTSTSTSSPTQPLRIKLPAHTTVYRKRKPAHVCQKSTCQNLLTRSARWKMCLGCRIRVREYERARRGGYAKWLKSDGEDDEVEGMGEGGVEGQGSSEMLVLFGGRRKCAIRTCTEIIPPLTTYRWKLCEGCRQRTRRRARELKHGAPLRSDCEDDDDEEEMPLKEKLAMKKRIQSLKGVKLTFKGRTVASVDTRAQELSEGLAAKGEDDKAMVVVGKDVKVKREVIVRSMLKPDNLERAPLYQTFETLLEDLHHLLSTYVKAHDMYVVMQLCRSAAASNESNTTPDVTKDDSTASKHADFIARNTATDKPQKNLKALPAMFSFSGEFSVVADPAGGDVGLHIETVQTLLGHYLGISLIRAGLTVDPAGTVTAAYNCSHEAVVNIPPGLFPLTPAPTPNSASAGQNTPSNPPPPPAVLRKLNGELNIVISWDRSHMYFPGMRTVVSFCLIG